MKINVRNKITLQSCIFAAFIAAETAIYIAFNVIMAVNQYDPVYLKYSGVLLCLVVAAAMIYFYKKDAVILTCALAFTAISDLFIFVLNSHYEIGVTTFFFAQAFYLYRLYADRLNRIYVTLAVRVVLAATAIIVLAVCTDINYLLAIVSVYFVMLCANCADAFILSKNGFKNVLFAVGLLLFIGCDVCVGMNNFGSALGIELPRGVLDFVGYGMWAFYLPSQVCIVCSVKKGGLKTGGKNEGIQTVQAS